MGFAGSMRANCCPSQPRRLNEALALEPQLEHLARDLAKSKDVLYLGRGTSIPIALEGALKLKEISYLHAEGYAAGELKRGPIALVMSSLFDQTDFSVVGATAARRGAASGLKLRASQPSLP
jgi:fructoselysine-6-P-deglycase FrlB-like protein